MLRLYQASLAVGSAQETHADGVVAVGGGSAIGLAKIVALALRLPLIAVPTTYAGSEMTSRYIVTTDRGVEMGTSDRVLPRTVIYDPDLVAPLPPDIVASSGMTAVAHCVEALSYPDAPAEAADWAREGLLLLWDSLGKIAAGAADLDCRQDALGRMREHGRTGTQCRRARPATPAHYEVAAGRYEATPVCCTPCSCRACCVLHGDQADQAQRRRCAELRPGVPAETALEEFSPRARHPRQILDELGIRSRITALTTEVSTHPAARPDRIQPPTVRRLQQLAGRTS